ncbi:ATP-binding protein [bacterium]|nr:ATP-binding protein [bacterium]
MALPEIAYPEPGWLSRFAGRREQIAFVDRILESIRRGVKLPIIQVVGEPGVGKSWFLQYLRYHWRDRVDVPVLIIRMTNPAMSQWDKAIDAVYTRLITRWRANLPLTEFVLGRIAHLRGEKIDRYMTYFSSLKFLPNLEKPGGDTWLRRILVEHGVEVFRKLWGFDWGKKFISMSPQELTWYLPQVFGMDIDQALRSIRMRALVLMIDDVELNPEAYFNALRLKQNSNLVLAIMAMHKPKPTGGIPAEIIFLEPLPQLERRAYLYSLGIERRPSQKKIQRKFGKTSIELALGTIKYKKLLDKNPALKRFIGSILVCHRPSLDTVLTLSEEQEAAIDFFSEPAFVDTLDKPDRLPWRVLMHPVAKKWFIKELGGLPYFDRVAGDELNRLSMFANHDFTAGIPMVYWYFRDAAARWAIGDAVDALFAADSIAENTGYTQFKALHRFLLIDLVRPRSDRERILNFARRTLLWRDKENDTIDLLVVAKCLLEAGRYLSAKIVANEVLRRFSKMVLDSGGKHSVATLLRAEANRILGVALAKLGDFTTAETAMSRALDAAVAAFGVSPALSDEASLERIAILTDYCRIAADKKDFSKAWGHASSAVKLALGVIKGAEHRFLPVILMAGDIINLISRHRLWTFAPKEVLDWLDKLGSILVDRWRVSGVDSFAVLLTRILLENAKILVAEGNYRLAESKLNILEDSLPIMGEMYHWRADLWRSTAVELRICRADLNAGLGNPEKSYKHCKEAINTLKSWDMDHKHAELLFKARVIGGLALARLENFVEAYDWLKDAIEVWEKLLIERKSDLELFEFLALCADAYHELARIEFERKNIDNTIEFARKGLQLRRRLMQISRMPDMYLQTTKLYTLLLEALRQKKFSVELRQVYKETIKVLIETCMINREHAANCRKIGEELFSFGLELVADPSCKNDHELMLVVLSLYPLLEKEQLIMAAEGLAQNLRKKTLPEDLKMRLTQIMDLMQRSE